MNKRTTPVKKSALAPSVLVSGGAGFIGSHLVESLLLNGARVVVIDNFSTGKKANLSNVLDHPKFSLIEWDINNGLPENIEAVDYIFHLAGVESYVYGDENITLDSLLTNAVGTKNLLDLAKKSYSKFVLVSSTDVYDGVISATDLNHYFGKTEIEEKKYSHSEAKRFAEALVWEYHKKHHIDARIVRLPEIYGPRMDFASGGELGRLIQSLLKNEDLVVYGDGLEKSYYLFISDAVSGIGKAMFSDDTDGRIFTLSGTEPITVLELTYLVKGLSNASIQVVFKNPTEDGPKDHRISTEYPYELKWTPKVDLKSGITKTLKWSGYDLNFHPFKPAKLAEKEKKAAPMFEGSITSLRPETEKAATISLHEPEKLQASIKPTLKPALPKKPISSNKLIIEGALIALLGSFLVLAGVPAGKTFYYVKSGEKSLQSAKASLEKLDLETAGTEASNATNEFRQARSEYSKLGWLFILGGQEKRLRAYAKVMKVAEYVSSAISEGTEGAKPLTEVWSNLKPTSAGKVEEGILLQTESRFKTAREELQRAQAETKDLDLKLLPGKVGEAVTLFKENVGFATGVLETAEKSVATLPGLIGLEKPRKYLILFQNPNELRATGGFVGSYAVASFEEGKIKEVTIDDIYNVDGLLDLDSYNEAAYAPIKEFSKQPYMRIRDANWQADFSESAETILDLFEKANGSTYDGVIGIDIYLVRSLLEATGPIFLTAYNEEITAENVYERAQYHSEATYTPGSQQKRAFLTVLGGKLLETLFSLPNEKVAKLAAKISESLDEKHMLLYIPTNQIAVVINEKGWDGRVNPTKSDFLYVVESNVGSNKANYFVKRTMDYSVKNTYRDGSLEGTLSLNWQHTGEDTSWPGGIYTNYLRVLVPKEAFLHKAVYLVEGKPEEDVTKKILIGEEAEKRTFELPILLNPNEKVNLVLIYSLPSNISLGKGEQVYSLVWQKQPGTDEDPISFRFYEPFGKKIDYTTPSMTKIEDGYEAKLPFQKDMHFMINVK